MYESLISNALKVAGMDEEKIISSSLWIALKLLYDEMIIKNEIVPIEKISKDEKIMYWMKTKRVTNERWKIISMSQALYLRNLIINK